MTRDSSPPAPVLLALSKWAASAIMRLPELGPARPSQRAWEITMRSEEDVAEALEAFVSFADTLAGGFDIAEFLNRLAFDCMRLCGADAVGLMLADGDGRLRLMAASSEQARLLELFQLQAEEGPCLEAHRHGDPVQVPDVAAAHARWPRFAPTCRLAGYGGVYAVPMRHSGQVIGALNLFRHTTEGLAPATLRIAQALTDVATIGLLTHRAQHDQSTLVEQLQTALTSRIAIEQAKGVLAERHRIDTAQAFDLMRRHARSHNQRLTELAHRVASGHADVR